MFKIWAKTFNENNRMINNQTFEFSQEFDAKYLNAYMQVICSAWKTETPIILSYHVQNLIEFNRVKFGKSDFVDNVDFKYLTIELI